MRDDCNMPAYLEQGCDQNEYWLAGRLEQQAAERARASYVNALSCAHGDRHCRGCGHLECGCDDVAAVDQQPKADPTPHPGEWAADVYPCGEWGASRDGWLGRWTVGFERKLVAIVKDRGERWRWNVFVKTDLGNKWLDDTHNPLNLCDTIEQAKAAADARLRPAVVEPADEWTEVGSGTHWFRKDGDDSAGRVTLLDDGAWEAWRRSPLGYSEFSYEADARAWVEAEDAP